MSTIANDARAYLRSMGVTTTAQNPTPLSESMARYLECSQHRRFCDVTDCTQLR